ncbi:MAG TPA: HAMP domain-containing sensor histidine kinase [Longimicrobiaceae bacterium]|nr:HAMP domain-containing sensor histidine kinase [Longimicrobiaceae bacterium]
MHGLSLRTKVFFLFAGAALLIVVPALVLIARTVEQRVYERATGELAGASTALGRNWALRDSLLLKEANARAVSPGLAEAWLAGNMGRMRRLLARGLDPDRVVLAADSTGVLVGPELDPDVLRDARSLGTIVTLLQDGEAPIRIAIWPVPTDSGVVGVAGVGTTLGPSTVEDLKKDIAGGTDMALVVGDSLIASTFADTTGADLREMDMSAVLSSGGTWKRYLGGRPYLSIAYELPTRGVPASVLLFRPIADELRLASGIRRSLIAIGLAALVMALVLAGLVSRIVARPAQALVEASGRLAHGDYNAPLPPASGDEIGQLTLAFGDMRSAIAEREARLRSAQAEMIHREKLAAMGRLVAQLSHEINNPIYNIQNCLEALDRRGNPNDPNREFLTLAREELARMATLTRQLLDQSRPLSDAARPLDLNQVARRVVTLAAAELEGHGVRLDLDLEEDLPAVVAHPDAIQQVLANLVNNAIDAMPDGGNLRVSTRSDSDGVEVRVEDSGTGIAENQLPHIFEAFYTTKPDVRGIGLGLFVSEGIIRGHRGRLWAESEMGEGSRFVIRLPQETLAPAMAASVA